MGRQSRIKNYRTSRTPLSTPRDLIVWVFDNCRFRTRVRAGLIADKHTARGRYDKHTPDEQSQKRPFIDEYTGRSPVMVVEVPWSALQVGEALPDIGPNTRGSITGIPEEVLRQMMQEPGVKGD